jgi:hypothetical protein
MEVLDPSALPEVENILAALNIGKVGAMIDFKIVAEGAGRNEEIIDFGGIYVSRTIPLNEQPGSEGVTAVLFDPASSTISYVPSVVTTVNGKSEVTIYTAHNSIYTIVETKPKIFEDVVNHWAKQDIDLLSSKLILNGISESEFAPDRAITRAEFAAMLVRALAIQENGPSKSYLDVMASSWYSSAIQAASKVSLVEGIADNKFDPNALITREQMVVMVARAMKMIKPVTGNSGGVSSVVDYKDQGDVSDWSRSAFEDTLKEGIINGYSDRLLPDEHATRAQASSVLKRLLKYLKFMN